MKLINKLLIFIIFLCFLVFIFFSSKSGYLFLNNTDLEYAYTVGAALPLTGNSQLMGNYNKMGMDLALEEINKDGKNLNIVFEDTISSNKEAINAINNLINIYDFPIILSSASSVEGMAIAPIVQNNSKVLLAAGVAANNYKYSGDYIFRVKSSVFDEVDFLLNYIDSKEDLQTIYLLYVQNDYGESVKESFLEVINSKNIDLIGNEGFSITETEFKTYLLKVKNANPDVLFISGWTNNHGVLVKQIGELGVSSKIVSSSAPITQDVLDVAGDFANGVIYSLEFSLKEEDILNKFVYSVENHRNNSALFFEKFKEKHDQEANLFAAMGYDAVMLAYDALKECGNDSDCIKDYFYSLEVYNGASGIFSFDEYGDVSKEMYLMTIRDGKFESYD